MGLDTTHDCWHGSYGGFHNWRGNLCRIAGLGEIDDYVGFGGEKPWPRKSVEPLVILFHHSDCDGCIRVEDLRPLANRLAKLLRDTMPEGGFVEGTAQDATVSRTKQFIAGLRRAAKAGEPVGFH